jgi:hypothetical protein
LRYRRFTKGIHPDYPEVEVVVAYGHDAIPGYTPGYFIQVYSPRQEDIDKCPTKEGFICNEGFFHGLKEKEVREIAKRYQAKLRLQRYKPTGKSVN